MKGLPEAVLFFLLLLNKPKHRLNPALEAYLCPL